MRMRVPFISLFFGFRTAFMDLGRAAFIQTFLKLHRKVPQSSKNRERSNGIISVQCNSAVRRYLLALKSLNCHPIKGTQLDNVRQKGAIEVLRDEFLAK